MVAGGPVFARSAVARLVDAIPGRLAPAEPLLDFTALVSCGLTLIFVPFVDLSLLAYRPCATSSPATRRCGSQSNVFAWRGPAERVFSDWTNSFIGYLKMMFDPA